MRKTFEIPLDIPDVTIQTVETDRHGDFVITVKSTVEGTSCHTCGKKVTKVYGYDREITLRHLPILGRKTYIRLRPVRYQCPYCDEHPTTTQQGRIPIFPVRFPAEPGAKWPYVSTSSTDPLCSTNATGGWPRHWLDTKSDSALSGAD